MADAHRNVVDARTQEERHTGRAQTLARRCSASPTRALAVCITRSASDSTASALVATRAGATLPVGAPPRSRNDTLSRRLDVSSHPKLRHAPWHCEPSVISPQLWCGRADAWQRLATHSATRATLFAMTLPRFSRFGGHFVKIFGRLIISSFFTVLAPPTLALALSLSLSFLLPDSA